MTMPIKLGTHLLLDLGETVTVEGVTAGGVECSGVECRFEVSSATDAMRLIIRDVAWSNGERDIAVVDRLESPQPYDKLVGRLRLGVRTHGDGIVFDLRQARVKPNGHVNLFDADHEQLAAGAGLDVATTLKEHGATAVDSRESVLGDDGRTRFRLAAAAPADRTLVPVVAYVLTRVGPVSRGFVA